MLPKYSHFLDDNKYAAPLAKRHLLGHPNRLSIGAEGLNLYHAMRDFGESYKAWGYGTDIAADPRFKDEVTAANLVWDKCKKTSAAIAAVNALQEDEGIVQQDNVDKLLAEPKVQLLPLSLKKELEKIRQRATKKQTT